MSADYIRAWRERQRATFAALAAKTESPLEAVMLAALLAEDDGAGGYFFTADGPNTIVAQCEANNGRRRIDFAVFVGERKIAVEVDGGEWHDAPELASETDARARELESIGWEVIRFAGSDVSRRARDCARYVREHIGCTWHQEITTAATIPEVQLSPSHAAHAEQTSEECAASTLFETVLREPHHIHRADVFAALTCVGGAVALAAEALRRATAPNGNVDASTFLASCPAILQPAAVKKLVAVRGEDNLGVALLVDLQMRTISGLDSSTVQRRRR